MSVNRGLIALYWDIGRTIVAAQKDKGYGKQVVERLASDLRREFPDMAGFSPQNVWFMRGFYLAWAEGEEVQKLQRPVGVSPILLQAVRELPERGKCTAIPAESEPNLSQHVRESTEKKLSQPVTESMTVPPEPIASLPWGHNR